MTVSLIPYLHFDGQAHAALDFYAQVLGGTPSVMGYDSIPGMADHAPTPDSIMHGELVTDLGQTIFAADSSETKLPTLTLVGEPARLRALAAALGEGGTVVEPLAVAPWGDLFGIVVDRFGVEWYFSGPAAGDG